MSEPKRDMPNSTTRITAPPGTPEYESQMLAQGQAAMDRAVAMPLVRIAFGLFFAMMAASIVGKVLTAWLEGGWQAVLRDPHIHVPAEFAMMLGAGAVAFTGRARRKWFYDYFSRKRTWGERNPPRQPPAATEGR